MQACVVPFRSKRDQLEICLITSLKKQRWILPKGIIEAGESCEEAALKEALEEAGLRGHIVGDALGSYEDHKWGCLLQVTVLLMEVTQCDDQWFESDVRQRCWVSPERAMELLSKPILRQLVDIAVKRIL